MAVAGPTHGAPTISGSIQWCLTSARLCPSRELTPWCVTSARTPVWVAGHRPACCALIPHPSLTTPTRSAAIREKPVRGLPLAVPGVGDLPDAPERPFGWAGGAEH